MIHFILPNFYDNLFVNNFFYSLSNLKPNYFKNENIIFILQKGNFAYNSWNGGFSNNHGNGAFYSEINSLAEKTLFPIAFDFSNIFLEETDFYDTMSNIILRANEASGNYIEISNLSLLDYIKNSYQDYKFIFSKNTYYLYPYDESILNTIIKEDNFKFISLPSIFNNDFDFLNKINNKSKLILTINDSCNHYCKNYMQCQISENKSQIEFSEKSIKMCKKRYDFSNNKNLLTLENLKNDYLPLGINHFEIEDNFNDIYDYINFLIDFFIKEEYKKEILFDILAGEKKIEI